MSMVPREGGEVLFTLIQLLSLFVEETYPLADELQHDFEWQLNDEVKQTGDKVELLIFSTKPLPHHDKRHLGEIADGGEQSAALVGHFEFACLAV